MNLIHGGEVLVDCLRKQGVRQVFSIIGGQMGTIYDTIGQRDDIDVFVPRCETVTPLMAAGYTASSGLPSVSLTTVGAGVVYEIGGLAWAWLNYAPVISLALQVQSFKMKPHQENLQACNQDELYTPLTKWTTIIYHWKRIPQLLIRGFREVYTGVPGPVHIDIPVDILFKRGIWSQKRLDKVPVIDREIRLPGVSAQILSAVGVLKKAKKPVVVLGQGIGRTSRYRDIRGTLSGSGLPVVTTRYSTGVFRDGDEAYAGAASLYAGRDQGRAHLMAADAVVVIGVDPEAIDLISICDWTSKPIIQIELDPSSFLTHTRYPVQADPVSAVSEIVMSGIDAVEKEAWLNRFKPMIAELACSPVGQGIDGVIEAVAKNTGPNDIIVADGADISSAAACVFRHAEYQDLFCLDEKDMPGVGLPFAIGAAMANKDAGVTLFCDKRSLFAHVRELSPAAQAGISLRIIVADDDDSSVNCSDTEMVLKGFGCSVKRQTHWEGKIAQPGPGLISALVIDLQPTDNSLACGEAYRHLDDRDRVTGHPR